MGPFRKKVIFGALYAAVVTCEACGVIRPYLMKQKSNWPAAMHSNAKRWSAERQPWRIMRSDNAPDLIKGQAQDVADEWDIIFEYTPPREPAANGRAESAVGVVKDGIATAMCTAPHSSVLRQKLR